MGTTTETTPQTFWRKCSSCKKPIGFGEKYYVCSVSTCNGQRTGYVFCSVPCFERHLPTARHKDAGAVEKTAPMVPPPPESAATSAAPDSAAKTPQRVFASVKPSTASQPGGNPGVRPATPKEVLVIASRLKDYVQAKSEFNTSQSVMDVLSDHLRVVCDRAIENARADGRKTVMDRDFAFLKS
jgi:hypothetical protein